jgi:8-oxo-dGTP diphosphatase
MAIHVVAAAIVRNRLVLAARRVRPVVGWEFPGGKVEPGETETAALVREICEELGVAVDVGTRLGEVADGRVRLVLYAVELISGEPAAHDDHDALRWLAGAELHEVDWLPIDRRLLDLVREVLL